jgi:metallophosphoesterase (TIGR00282 family)
MFRILFIGDIVGSFGRHMVTKHVPLLREKYAIDFVIANGENVTHGKGIIRHHFDVLIQAGIDVVTLGNHYDAKSEIKSFIHETPQLIRPFNIKQEFPGLGSDVFEVQGLTIRVTNMMGQAFMEKTNQSTLHNPFERMEQLLKDKPTTFHIVDFHAEATGEKHAFAYAFDGQVTAVLGTHTHVQTSDARVLPQGTAYMTDVGMTGAHDGILGVKKEAVIGRMWKGTPGSFEPLDQGEGVLSAVVLECDEKMGRVNAIHALQVKEKR